MPTHKAMHVDVHASRGALMPGRNTEVQNLVRWAAMVSGSPVTICTL